MSRKIKDNSPRFDKNKSYAIGVLQGNSSPMEVPERFASSPVKPAYLTGGELIGNGMQSCRDFLISSNCHFRIGSAVHFYEVEYQENDAPIYKNIFIGSPVKPAPIYQEQGLNDRVDGHIINNIIPNTHTSEYEKMFFRSQDEAIKYYQKCLQDERKEFNTERNIYVSKLEQQKDDILKLTLEINKLQSENDGLKIKYEESNKFADRIVEMSKKDEVSEPEGLADKGIAMIDGMLGDGASQQIIGGIASGLGNGIGKLIDLGVDYIREKGIVKPSQPQVVEQEINN